MFNSDRSKWSALWGRSGDAGCYRSNRRRSLRVVQSIGNPTGAKAILLLPIPQHYYVLIPIRAQEMAPPVPAQPVITIIGDTTLSGKARERNLGG
ncbi:MAG: hypothetical protein U5K54_27350 [Cytophagales bacterium]|nr:hypothetical protein [Cytophagales bacterium]